MPDRERSKQRTWTENNRETALKEIDSWADLAERKNEEASAAYALAREREDQLKAMTEARDLCKSQTTTVSSRLLSLRTWLRDEHPDVYGAIPGDVG